MNAAKSVALRYDPSLPAPFVIAKGKGLLAERLCKLAEQNGVPVVRSGELVESLFVIETEHFIPEPFYQVVAELLAYVWKTRNDSREPSLRQEKK